ncbi:MAG: Xaa-Pro dipeptidase [Woeseiaceae bacterium]|nr:Xaa-Pro dipeptidase [Woeseiaceae bacterium]
MDSAYSDKNPDLGRLYGAHLATVCKRYDHALQASGASHAVVFSGAAHPVFLDDTYYPFRAAANFVCWAPLNDLPLSYVVYTPGERPVLVYYQPHDYWHVVPGAPDGYWTRYFDIRIVHELADASEHLPEIRDNCVFIGEALEPAQALGVERINPSMTLNLLHYARGQKTEYEIECMRLASRRGVAGHNAAKQAFMDGHPEFAIHKAYCDAVSLTDNELPYDNIIALNEHAAVLHYTALDREAPAPYRSFLIDAGAQVHGYASDITRTYSFDGPDFAALIDRMEALQLDVVSEVKAGVDYKELHVQTHHRIADVLVEADIATGSSESLLINGVTSTFFPHGLGHLLGAQVHDVGGHMENENGNTIDPPSGHPFLRLTRTLKENMVVTIEPGLYFIDLLLDKLKGTPAEKQVNWQRVTELKPFGGIRIEDDVRVLPDGCENLTRDAFSAV